MSKKPKKAAPQAPREPLIVEVPTVLTRIATQLRSPHEDACEVLAAIQQHPGLRTSQVVKLLELSVNRVEDAIWTLWSDGRIQMENDSTLRVTREGETLFRHFAP